MAPDSTKPRFAWEIYEQGKGVPKDYAQAMQWYWKAAKQGNADGEQAVGRMYEKGEGVQQDSAEAKKWYDKAAAQ